MKAAARNALGPSLQRDGAGRVAKVIPMPGPEILALFIPILALTIPIVAILTAHQRKMAELFHQNQGQQMNPELLHEIRMMRAEIQSLRETVNTQAIAMDDLRGLAVKPPATGLPQPGDDFEQRLKSL